MGRNGAQAEALAQAPVAAPDGFQAPALVWLHVQPASQQLLLVPELGVAEGELLTPKMMEDVQRAGWCEEVAYHAGYDQYWKMPTQEAILRMPSLYDIPCPLANRMQLQTKLVREGEARGFWMRVRIRSEAELAVLLEDPAATAAPQ